MIHMSDIGIGIDGEIGLYTLLTFCFLLIVFPFSVFSFPSARRNSLKVKKKE